MSSVGNLNFGIRISAHDGTQGAIRQAESGFARLRALVSRPLVAGFKVAEIGLGALRDVNLGLLPIIRGLDQIIERGAGLEVVTNSFRALTGASGPRLNALARSLVNAASGTITLAKGMELANRGLAAGLGFEQIQTAIEFISKKAISTGRDAGQAIDTIFTGLSRGSTLFLDDFGILVDGAEGVRAAFDRIKGSGAFDQLGPAAQKAETVRQAITEMEGQLGRIGVTGREAIFTFSGIKNEIANMVDKLAFAVAGSKAVRESMTSLRGILVGMSEHFAAGGGFWEILIGKNSNGGLLGIAGSLFMDLGELIARGLVDGVVSMKDRLTTLAQSIWKASIGKALAGDGDGLLGPSGPLGVGGPGGRIGGLTRIGMEIGSLINSWSPESLGFARKARDAAAEGDIRGYLQQSGNMLGQAAYDAWSNPSAFMATMAAESFIAARHALSQIGLGGLLGNRSPATSQPATQPAARASSNPLLNAALLAATSSIGGVADPEVGFFRRTQQAISSFGDDFPQRQSIEDLKLAATFRLTSGMRASLIQSIRGDERRLKAVAAGGEGLRAQALRESGVAVNELVKEGRVVTPRERKYLFETRLQELIDERSAKVQRDIDEKSAIVRESDVKREYDRQNALLYRSGPGSAANQSGQSLQKMAEAQGKTAEGTSSLLNEIKQLVAIAKDIAGSLAGADRDLARA